MCANKLLPVFLAAGLMLAGTAHAATPAAAAAAAQPAKAAAPAVVKKTKKKKAVKKAETAAAAAPAAPVETAPAAEPVTAPSAPVAATSLGGDLQFHGFLSQGFTLSKGNNVNGSSKDDTASLRYQEFGLNASWRPRGNLLLAGQLASVRNGNAVDEYLLLEYGLIDYTPWQGESGRFGLRGGKLKLPIGFYNDSRDAVFTRPSILLPAMYLDVSGGRSFGYFSEVGLALYGDIYAGEHAFYLEGIGFGEQSLGDNADIAILRTKATGQFRIQHGALLRIADDYDGGRARAALSFATVKINYEADHSQAFSPTNLFAQDGGFDFRQVQLSLQYNWPQFSLTSEYVWRTFEVDELIPANPFGASFKVDLDPSAFYVQGTWRMTPKWSGFLRYDEEIRDSHDRDGEQLGARFGLPGHYFYAHDWTAGTRYDLRSNLGLWAEFHYVEGDIWVNPLDNPDFSQGTAPRYWNLFTLMLGYRF